MSFFINAMAHYESSKVLYLIQAQRLGVLCEPEVQVRELTPDDCYLILATDGVWDGMSSQEVATFVDREACSDSNVDAATASSRLNEVALKALDANQIDDNISNVCVFIRFHSYYAYDFLTALW
ncbi:hypothetical protein BDF22DRAFT_658588 [Syncephalis plumigaleata]|nr:hypothetical protein BDF22DRAFT_658588 [Syncephalis plumigaleata]